MKKRRIFIKYLPEMVKKGEIETAFSDYGKVLDIDVKERKNLDSESSKSRYFAYINVEIDDYNLQRCFNDFQNNLWHGQYLELQLAKESFLEQLKRERAESSKISGSHVRLGNNSEQEKQSEDKNETVNFKSDKTVIKKVQLNVKVPKQRARIEEDTSEISKPSDHSQTKVNNGILKNESKKHSNLTPSEIKRSQSVNEMIKGYRQQKLIIKAALANVDSKVNKKIKFDENNGLKEQRTEEESSKVNEDRKCEKNTLFESDEESENDFNFEVKKTFEGKEGKKLFELQSRYKNDKRFILDERFVDEEKEENDVENPEITNIAEEKKKEFEILEQLLGNRVKQKNQNFGQERCKRGMLRFDPTQSDHSKYEIQITEDNTKKVKRKREPLKSEVVVEKNETEQPNVSKEVFYKVSTDLKEAFEKPQNFSLLNSFGTTIEELDNQEEQPKEIKKNTKLSVDINPFRYDSSEDEETDNLQNNEDFHSATNTEKNVESNPKKLWSEPFFFRDDDYRFQEGSDFVKRISSERNEEFVQLRRDLKSIVKAKVRNNQRKSRPFKKKLGGNKRKKMIRIKKAMKR